MRAQVRPLRCVVPSHGRVDRFAYKRGVTGSNPVAPTGSRARSEAHRTAPIHDSGIGAVAVLGGIWGGPVGLCPGPPIRPGRAGGRDGPPRLAGRRGTGEQVVEERDGGVRVEGGPVPQRLLPAGRGPRVRSSRIACVTWVYRPRIPASWPSRCSARISGDRHLGHPRPAAVPQAVGRRASPRPERQVGEHRPPGSPPPGQCSLPVLGR